VQVKKLALIVAGALVCIAALLPHLAIGQARKPTAGFPCTTTSINFASIAAQTCGANTIVCTGGIASDPVIPRWPVSGLNTGLAGMMWVTAADTVTVRLCNVTTGAIDPGAMDFGASILR
jgi:hypothetical protein